MLALHSSFTSHMVPEPTVLPDIEVTASRIMQFDSKGKCLTSDIAFAIIAVLKSPSTELATKVNIFRNALVCGYERDLLDRIEDRMADFEPGIALCETLEDEGILLRKEGGFFYLTRSHVQQEADPALELASDVLSEFGLPTDIVKLIVTKTCITPYEKLGALAHYLRRDIREETQKSIHDSLLWVFRNSRRLPEGQKRLEITDFEFSVPLTETVMVPPWVKLKDCRLTSGTLILWTGTLTSIHQDGIAYAWAHKATAFAGVPGAVARAKERGIAVAIAENSTASSEGPGSRSFAKAPLSSAIARRYARAHALAPSSSATAYDGAWAIAGAHSSACAINEEGQWAPPITMTELQYSVFEGKSRLVRGALSLLMQKDISTLSVLLSLPDSVFPALDYLHEKIWRLDIAAAKSLSRLLENEKFIEELGSLATLQALKKGTIDLRDLMQKYGSDSSERSSSGSTLSSSSSSSSTSSGMSD